MPRVGKRNALTLLILLCSGALLSYGSELPTDAERLVTAAEDLSGGASSPKASGDSPSAAALIAKQTRGRTTKKSEIAGSSGLSANKRLRGMSSGASSETSEEPKRYAINYFSKRFTLKDLEVKDLIPEHASSGSDSDDEPLAPNSNSIVVTENGEWPEVGRPAVVITYDEIRKAIVAESTPGLGSITLMLRRYYQDEDEAEGIEMISIPISGQAVELHIRKEPQYNYQANIVDHEPDDIRFALPFNEQREVYHNLKDLVIEARWIEGFRLQTFEDLTPGGKSVMYQFFIDGQVKGGPVEAGKLMIMTDLTKEQEKAGVVITVIRLS